MAKPEIPPGLAPLVGDYTGTSDHCLYRVGYRAGQLWFSRCCRCGPDPAAAKIPAWVPSFSPKPPNHAPSI